ncbi:hypothetical protein BH09ACT12_BH09ACT12_04980 [soil metagenome]
MTESRGPINPGSGQARRANVIEWGNGYRSINREDC